MQVVMISWLSAISRGALALLLLCGLWGGVCDGDCHDESGADTGTHLALDLDCECVCHQPCMPDTGITLQGEMMLVSTILQPEPTALADQYVAGGDPPPDRSI